MNGTKFKEVRFIMGEDETHCYVCIETTVRGHVASRKWHYESFPPFSLIDVILQELMMSASSWPQESPEDKEKK